VAKARGSTRLARQIVGAEDKEYKATNDPCCQIGYTGTSPYQSVAYQFNQ